MSTLLVRPITGSHLFGLHTPVPRELGLSRNEGETSKVGSSVALSSNVQGSSSVTGIIAQTLGETGAVGGSVSSLAAQQLVDAELKTRGADMLHRNAENEFAHVSTKNAEKPKAAAGTSSGPGAVARAPAGPTPLTAAPASESRQEVAAEASNVDRELVERAQRGESDAYRELVERYERRALAIAMGLLGNPEDARDLVQQAFLKAYRSLSSFRGQSSFYTWLYRILVNLSIDFSRKAYRRAEQGFDDANLLDAYAQRSTSSPDDYLGHLDGPEQRVQRVELRGRLEQALGALSNEHRTVIILREIEGLSYSEISEAVGCSKGTVMSRLHHARKRLQKALGDLRPIGSQRKDAAGEDSDNAEVPEDVDSEAD